MFVTVESFNGGGFVPVSMLVHIIPFFSIMALLERFIMLNC